MGKALKEFQLCDQTTPQESKIPQDDVIKFFDLLYTRFCDISQLHWVIELKHSTE